MVSTCTGSMPFTPLPARTRAAAEEHTPDACRPGRAEQPAQPQGDVVVGDRQRPPTDTPRPDRHKCRARDIDFEALDKQILALFDHHRLARAT